MGESQQLRGEAACKKDDFIQRGQLETMNMYSFRYLEARIPKKKKKRKSKPLSLTAWKKICREFRVEFRIEETIMGKWVS